MNNMKIEQLKRVANTVCGLLLLCKILTVVVAVLFLYAFSNGNVEFMPAIIAIVQLVCIVGTIWTLSGVFKDLRNNGNPFNQNYPQKLRKAANFILASAILELCSLLIVFVSQGSFNITIDLFGFVFAGVLITFAHIIDYGCSLNM